IDINVVSDTSLAVTGALEAEGYQFDLERKQVIKHDEARVFTHIHVFDRFNFELTVYAEDKAHYVFKSSITGKAIERASIRELEELLLREYPGINLDEELQDSTSAVDAYHLDRMLLLPLENVEQSEKDDAERDA